MAKRRRQPDEVPAHWVDDVSRLRNDRRSRFALAPVYDFDPLEEGMAAGARRKRVANTARGTSAGPSGTINVGATPRRLALPAGRGVAAEVAAEAAATGAGGLFGAGPRAAASAAAGASKWAGAARFGLYGLAALTAYDAVSRVFDATEGEDNRQQVTRTQRELALGEDQDASIEAMMLNDENDGMRKMQGLRDAVSNVESGVATRDAIDLAEIIEGKKGQLEGYASIMGPSPLEVEARFRSLFGG